MKYKRQISFLLILGILLPIFSPIEVAMASMGKEEILPLQLEEMAPEDGVSMEGIEGELSLTFNQPVTIQEGKQVQLLYDKEGDSKPDDPVLIKEEQQEGEEGAEPYDGVGGELGEYTDVLSIDKEDSKKVLVDLTYLEENILEENHVYQLNIYEVIKAEDHDEIFSGLGLTEAMDTWVFDTETENEVTSIYLEGPEEVNQGEKTTLEATVRNQHDHVLLEEKVIWSSDDETKATIHENTGEITGVSSGTVTVTAIGQSNPEITTTNEITVQSEPLELIQRTPEHEGSLGGTEGEISLEFNQPVEIVDEEAQVRMRYDRNKDGNVKTNLRNAEGELSYTDVIKVDEDNPNKVIIKVNDILEEGHTYYLWILPDRIRAQDGEELFSGFSAGDWTFDVKEIDVEPLELIQRTPEHEGSLGGTEGEISLEFNQPVEIADEEAQVRMRYDRNKDGDIKTNLRNADGELSYTDVIKVDEDNPNKVIIEVNDNLEEGHSYYLWILADKIRARNGGELFSGFSVGDWMFDAKEIVVEPLELIQRTPEHEGSLGGTEGEISLEFNQPVEIADEEAQVRMRYDRNKDGDIKTNLRNAEGELSYTDVIKVDEDNPNKVIIEINDILEEGHTYYLWILEDKIKAQNGSELYPGFDRGDWEFDAKIHTGQASAIEITGGTAVQVEDKITLEANVKDGDGNTLPNQEINWSTEDVSIAAVESKTVNTAEVTGVATGKGIITATLASDEEVKATIEITVGNPLDYKLMVKQAMQISPQKGVEVRGISMNQGTVYALVDDIHQSTTKLYAYDLYGNLLWGTDLGKGSLGNSSSVPAFDQEGNIYLRYKTTSNSLVYAISPDGDVQWEKQVEGKTRGGIVVDEPLIVDGQMVFTVEKGIYSLNTSNGDILWHKDINTQGLEADASRYWIASSPVSHGNTIYVAVNGNNAGITDGKIQAYDKDGSEKWDYISKSRVLDPMVNDTSIYVVDGKGNVAVLGQDDGNIRSSHPLNGYTVNDTSSVGEAIIGNDGTLYMLYNAIDGTEKAAAIDSSGRLLYSVAHPYGRTSTVDDEGYLYTVSNNSEGRATIYALDPYGNLGDTVSGYDSTVTRYFNIKAYDNVLLGSRSVHGQWVAAKIQHHTGETPQSIEWLQPDKTLGVGLNDAIGIRVKNTQGKAMIADGLQWTSSDESILSVVDAEKGVFKGIKEGSVEVSVSLKDKPGIRLSRHVVVENKESVPTTVEILSEDGQVIDNAIDIEYKIPYQFGFKVRDQYGDEITEEEVQWVRQLNLSNVYVDETGLLKPESTGSYPITVISSKDNSVRKDITVNIKREEARFGGILPREAVLTLPGEMQLHPSNQYGEPFTLDGIDWANADPSIAKVDETGKVMAIAYGTTTVTGTKGSDSFTKEIHVVEPFGYDWNKAHDNRIRDALTEDPDGNLYYGIVGENQLVSVNPDGSENWNIEIDSSIGLVQWAGDGLYYSTSSRLIRMNPENGEEIWRIDLDRNPLGNIHINEANGNLYVASQNMFYAVDRNSGEIKWNLSFEGGIYNYTVDDEGNIFLPVQVPGTRDTNILKVMDQGESYQILETNMLEGVSFVPTGSDFMVDHSGVLYSYFTGTIDEITGSGVLAVEEGQIKWVHYFDSIYRSTSGVKKMALGKNGEIYFTSSNPNTSRQMGKIGALDPEGNLLWEKELTDLVESGKTMYASGDFEVDQEGNIYMPMMVTADGRMNNLETSVLVQMDSQGKVIKYLSYHLDRYGRFDHIHLSEHGIYVKGDRGQRLIKFAFENTQEQVPSEIYLQAPKDSIAVGDYLDIRATVYSQIGIAMAEEKVTWSSNMRGVATVDAHGRVTAHKPGKTVITATSVTNPELKSTYELTIVDAGKHHITRDKLDEHVEKIVDNYKKKGIDGDWAAFAIDALGEDINSPEYATNNRPYVARLLDIVSASSSLGNMTEYERMTLAILAGGYDPHDFGGMNLIDKIANYRDLSQGNNAAIWGLIAFDAANATIPEGSKYSSEFFVDYILNHQAGKGWALSGNSPDVDITAMAVYALAPYYNGWKDYKQDAVKKAVNEAVEWIKSQQQEVGGFNYTGANKINTESTAQVIMALTSIGIDPQGSEFTRNGGNPVSAMLRNQMSDGTFMHETSINQSDHMSTSQALQALAALRRFNEKGYSDIFYNIAKDEPIEIEAWMELISDINLLPEYAKDVTLKHENLIQSLRSRYNALSKEDKEKITNLSRLIQAERRIKILKDQTAPDILTNLKNQKVTNQTLTFYAKGMDDVSGPLAARVKLNGKVVSGSGPDYRVTLKEGKNTITIMVVDENNNKTEESYTITYEVSGRGSKGSHVGKNNNTQTDGRKDEQQSTNISASAESTGSSEGIPRNIQPVGSLDNTSSVGNDPLATEEEVIQALREEIVAKVQKAESGDTITIDIKEGLSITAAMLDEMREKEDVTMIFRGKGYTLSFNTSDIAEGYDEDLEILLTMSFTSENEEKINELLGEVNGMIMHFDYDGVFPVPITVVVKLAEHLQDAEQLYLYYYNEETGELEFKEDANVVIQDGYAQFTIMHGSDYVLVDELLGEDAAIETTSAEMENPNQGQNNMNTTMIYIIAAILLGLGILVAMLYKRKSTQ